MKRFVLWIGIILFPIWMHAQTVNVKGIVQDDKGVPMPGATVVISGSSKGTMTDLDGRFFLKEVKEGASLEVSFIGYVTQTVQATNAPLKISLLPDVAGLEEIVVVGYGSQKKVNLLGAVENISMKELENRPLTSASMALQGQVAGVDVVQQSGQPGEDYGTIRIRGVSSIENNNEPLVLIDGIEGDINDVNPKDIETMSVLKDASSAAIYGSRAAAGVILITTKSGSEGDMRVSYNFNYGIQQSTQLPKPVDVFTWIDLKQEMLIYNGQKSQADALEDVREDYLSGKKVATNYYDFFFRTAPQQDHYLNISGGNRYTKASVSLGYTGQDGVLLGTSANKYTFRTNVDMKSKRNIINFKFNLSGYRKEIDEYTKSSSTVISSIHRAGPTSVFQAQNGLYGYYGMYYAQKELGGGGKKTQDGLSGRSQLTLNLFDGFKVIGAFNINYGQTRGTVFAPPLMTASDLYGDSQTEQQSYYEVRNIHSFSTTAEATAHYDKTFNKSHKLSAMAGFSQYKYNYDTEYARREDYTDFVPSLMHGSSATQINSDTQAERALRSFFARVGYSYKGRYLVEGNFRADGSSRFKNNKWGYFPSVSAGWRISEESFFQKIDPKRIVNNLKLRASWGMLGNESISSYYTGYDQIDMDFPYDLNGSVVSGAGLIAISNPNTTWETTRQTNIGIDLSLWNSFTVSADYFYKYTYDMLMQMPIPPSLGISSIPFQNAGSMENKGFELTLGYKKRINKDLRITAAATLSHVSNKIIDLNGQGPIFHKIADNSTPILISMEGQPYGSFYGYNVIGIFQESDFTWQNDSDPTIPVDERNYQLKSGIPTQAENPRPGDLRFEDISGPDGKPDGVIDMDYDRKIIGKQFPDLTYSLTLGAEYKGFDMNLFFHGVTGRDLYNCGAMVVPFANDNGNVWADMVDSRWTYENKSNTNPRLFNDNTRMNIRSNYYLQDASFLRLKNIEIGYSLPQKVLQKLHIEKCRIYAGIQNAFTITGFKGWDPERPATNISSDVYPQVRVYNFGLNLNF